MSEDLTVLACAGPKTLAERYARGEIDADEYDGRLDDRVARAR